ncbi:hypothetical protein SAMN02745172_02446 [Pseudoxanthobacter soli DSM 19599]|uniref:Chemotaxis protein n=1 Tax=Pseudoxanthobacter soli DSM 19599 TaxID=1123029 RepID=A0A1M7ZLX3_9HYPH|nr:chemotaxis protein [Pseudoxanthobacter soli]SHO65799.1 hypothetical protein SAMN02745172_02446 [Pseudoxanthobacter soli DSM 19599]
MKLVFRQYLASIRERGELDAVLPDLLSELGYTVLSRPSQGPRQYGVDIAALSPPDSSGKQSVYLFTVKQGDISRYEWDGDSRQSLRESINEIIDVYITTILPDSLRDNDIVICLCFGGEIKQSVRLNITGFESQMQRPGLTFEEWNGDHLASLLVNGILREHLLEPQLRSHFQKAIAMLDEPDISYEHFSSLIHRLCNVEDTTPKKRCTILRQLYICLWVLFVWARDAENLEAPYRASELALLHTWRLVKDDVASSTSMSEKVSECYAHLAELHFMIWNELLGRKIIPFVNFKHAVSVAVHSISTVDINLKLFEVLGRLSMRGLWMLWELNGAERCPIRKDGFLHPRVDELARNIVHLIRNNPILLSPISDIQSTDIAVTLLFLSMAGDWSKAASNYAVGISQRMRFCYLTHSQYPSIHHDYYTLARHPRENDDAYRIAATKGSTLFPLLGIWLASLGEHEEARIFAEFVKVELGHCNLQLWSPDVDSEEHLYTDSASHGTALSHIPITDDGEKAVQILSAESGETSPFFGLSAIKLEHWPIVALACRHYRLPLPPELWLPVIQALRSGKGG